MQVFRSRLFALLILAVGATGVVVARAPQTTAGIQTMPLSQPVPVDPELTKGTLPNGLRYYIRPNHNPQGRAELRLVVKAGSVLEDDDQRGLAHFVEHLAFRGTKNFPGSAVLSFLSSLGIGLGPDANAETGFDETVYKLQVPTDRPDTIDRSLRILQDWAQNVTFDSRAIDAERPVILEEWRLNRGASQRTNEKELPVLLQGSRYANREPIGVPEIIQSAPRERIVKFYTDWYRPDLMAVIAVGDLDPKAVEQSIKNDFSPLTNPTPARPRTKFDVPDHPGTVYLVTSDPEAQATSLEVSTLEPLRDQVSIGGYREQILFQYFTGLLSARYAEIAQRPDAAFVLAGAVDQMFFTRTKQAKSVEALAKEGQVEQTLDALMTEVSRAATSGFQPSELDRQKQLVMRAYERAVAEKASRDSPDRADEYIRNFLEDEALPSIEDEYALQVRFAKEITINDMNALAKTFLPDKNRFVMVRAPQKSGQTLPDEKKLAAVMTAAASKTTKAYVDTAANATLLDKKPTAGTIVKTSTRANTGLTEWELSNGVKVALVPLPVKDDAVVMKAVSPGGTSLASDQDFIPASVAGQIIGSSGVGTISDLDLRKMLTGKVVQVTPTFSELSTSLVGSASTKDLETFFQLIYLRFTQPRADPTIATVAASQVKALLANQSASPDWVFDETLTMAMSNNAPRRQLPDASTVDKWNLDKSLAFYKARFADASNFTFVFSGDFEIDKIKPLVEQYIASLPASPSRGPVRWRDLGIRPPDGVVEKTIEKGVEPKSQVAIVYHGPFQYDALHRAALEGMVSVLQSDLFDTIRTQLGGTYDISTSNTMEKNPTPSYSITIEWTCDPKRVDALIASVFREIDLMKQRMLTEAGMAQVRQSLMRRYENNIKQKGYLVNEISRKYELGEDVGDVWALPDTLQRLTAPMLQDAARTYLDGTYVKVVMNPEKK